VFRWIAVALITTPLLAAPAAALAQDTARTVLAAVVSGQGRPVVDVGIDDFVVSEGGQPREVLDVHVADYPIAVVLDDRPATAGNRAALQAAARRFIQRVGERPIALLRLSDAAHPLASLDDPRQVVLERLSGLDDARSESTAPLDTIAHAATTLGASGAPFSAVVVVAAGPVDATALVRGDLLPQILDSGAAVHVVQVQQPEAVAASADPDLLRLVADQSRGQFTAIFSSTSFDAALDRLADRLAIEMMVQYLVPADGKGGDVRVGVRLPGAHVVGLGVK
jgi:hypothetical protein